MNGATCPTCGRRLDGPITNWPRFPFCSHKCKLIDLGRWFGESYGIAKDKQDEETPPEPPDSP